MVNIPSPEWSLFGCSLDVHLPISRLVDIDLYPYLCRPQKVVECRDRTPDTSNHTRALWHCLSGAVSDGCSLIPHILLLVAMSQLSRGKIVCLALITLKIRSVAELIICLHPWSSDFWSNETPFYNLMRKAAWQSTRQSCQSWCPFTSGESKSKCGLWKHVCSETAETVNIFLSTSTIRNK